jgi:23S rRNA (adenine2503-C2)-methyltransferase
MSKINPFVYVLDAAAVSGDRKNDRSLFGLTHQQLRDVMASFGQPAYRAGQLAEGLYKHRYDDLSAFSTLPKTLREQLVEAGYQVGLPRIMQSFQSADGTERYLVECRDGETVETVWMPEGDGGEAGDGSEAGEEEEGPSLAIRKRATICVSSQIGCAVNCQFCLTAKLGLKRNLTAGEIAGQVAAVLKRKQVEIGRDRINLVFMGMGEPLLNYDNFLAAVRLLVEEVGIAESRMTVSTSGIVPAMERLAAERVRPKLAISLNAPNNEIREQVMPITRKWSVPAVLEAAGKLPLRPKEKITLEYVLLGGVTDQPEHADQLIRLVRRTNLPLKVNLIAWNPGPGVAYAMPDPDAVENFHQRLMSAGIPAFIRRPRGRDIYAACGQLKRTVSDKSDKEDS